MQTTSSAIILVLLTFLKPCVKPAFAAMVGGSKSKAIPTLVYPQLQEELQKTPNVVLLDVREPAELKTDGKITQAKNIPLGQVDAAFKMGDESFSAKYGFPKPDLAQPIIVFCKKGIRAMKAATALTQAGFEKVKVYPGIDDWVENGGPVER